MIFRSLPGYSRKNMTILNLHSNIDDSYHREDDHLTPL